MDDIDDVERVIAIAVACVLMACGSGAFLAAMWIAI